MQKISKKSLTQFLKYNFGGLVYFWSAWTIITFLTDDFGLFWTNLVGNLIGIVLNYLIQKFWTFKGGPDILASGWKFVTLTIVNLGISYLILSALERAGIALSIAQFISAGFFMGWNWFWYKFWVFKEKKSG